MTLRAARQLGLALVAASLCIMSGCASPTRKAQPPLFVVQDADTTIWLLGTIHALPAGIDWRSGAVDRAIAGADALVTEIPAVAPNAAAAAFLNTSRSSGALPIVARVPDKRRTALAGAIANARLSTESLNRLKSWAAAIVLANAQLRALGVSPDPAPEAELNRVFAGRPHLALETLGGQLALFDALSEADQRALLNDAIDAPAQYRRTLGAWAAGDLDALAATLAPMATRAPAAMASLVTARNRRWAAWITQRMAAPGKLLVAVGAGHLAGPQSVIALLRARGLKVARVR